MEVLEHKLNTLHSDVTDIKTSLRELSNAITKLALVEERLVQTTNGLGRAFTALEKLENRIAAVEKTNVYTVRSSKWVDRAIWGVIAAAAMYIAKQVRLL